MLQQITTLLFDNGGVIVNTGYLYHQATPFGLISALAAGMRCVVIPNGLSSNGQFEGAHAKLNDIRELPHLLASYNMLKEKHSYV